jgi:hypothetical protein
MPPVDTNTAKNTIFRFSHPFPPYYQATHAHYMLNLEVQLVSVHTLHASQSNSYINTTVMANS